jgi:hypothetical protein
MTLDALRTRLLDADIQYLIRTKARQLSRAGGFGRGDRCDLEQELTLRLLQRLAAYDPEKGSFYCFALVALDRVGKNLLESRNAACRDSSGTVSLHTPVTSPDGDQSRLADQVGDAERDNRRGRFTATEAEARDLASDVRDVLDALPADLRDLADRLVTASRARIVRDTRLPDARVRELFARLRDEFERAGLAAYLDGPRES